MVLLYVKSVILHIIKNMDIKKAFNYYEDEKNNKEITNILIMHEADILDKVKDILDPDYSFIMISSYTTGISHISLENILKLEFKNQKIECGENILPVTEDNLLLPCGIYGRVTKD